MKLNPVLTNLIIKTMKKLFLILFLFSICIDASAQFRKAELFGLTRLVDSLGSGSVNWFKIQRSNVQIPESLWVGRSVRIGYTSGHISLDTNGKGLIDFDGFNMTIENQKSGGSILLNALGQGSYMQFSSDSLTFKMSSNNYFEWTRQVGTFDIPIMTLNDSDLIVGEVTTGSPSISDKGILTHVHYGFYDDLNTGLLRQGADSLALVSGGGIRFNVGSTIATSYVPLFIDNNLTFNEIDFSPNPDLTAQNQCRLYMKGDKLIVAYETGTPDALDYWYLNLTNQASQSWTYSSTEP